VTDSKEFDPMDAQINMEIQRSEMQELLRRCRSSLMIAMVPGEGLVHAYMNISPVEHRGMAELIRDTAPRFYPVQTDEDGNEIDPDEG